MRSDPIAALASPRRSPDGIEYRSLSAEAAAAAAGELGVPLRQAEILALGRGIVPERYQRNMGSLGLDG